MMHNGSPGFEQFLANARPDDEQPYSTDMLGLDDVGCYSPRHHAFHSMAG